MLVRAKKRRPKPVDKLGVDYSPRIDIVSLEDPPERSAGISVEDVSALMTKLKEEAGVF